MNLTAESRQTGQRNYGIDLLRLVAAFYVIILHTVNQGGLFRATAPYSYQNYACRLLLIFSFCAVNIFGIVSGFVGYREPERKFSFAGFLSLWTDVVFYGAGFTLIYMCILPGTVTGKDLIPMFYPLTRNLYWYFSAYTMVYFLSPFLNKIIRHCSVKELKLLFFLICFIFVPIDFISGGFGMSGGYSSVWLILLYLIGAIMKKTGIGNRIRPHTAVFAVIILNGCLFFLNIKCPDITLLNIHLNFAFELTHSYVSPFFLASAVFHVILFSKMRITPVLQKIIRFAAPAAFAVYIVNVQHCVWNYFMKDRFVSWATGSPAGVIVRTIVFSFVFVLAVVMIDFCKRQVFQLLGVQKLTRKLEHALQRSIAGRSL